MKRYILVLVGVILFAAQGFCQENVSSENKDASQVSGDIAAPQEISIYGEVKSVNIAANSIIMKYYDYDSDNEKSVEIMIDNNTKIEGTSTLNDIKQGNWADVNYKVVDGKNMAKSIAVEKEEDAAVETPAS